MCVDMAEWSKALDSVLSTLRRQFGFEPSHAHIDRPYLLWREALGTGLSTLTSSAWADSVRYMSIGYMRLNK